MAELDAEHPCVRHSCHKCCIDTQMTLTVDDVARISSQGHRDFYFETEDGYLQMDNVDGHCFFLKRGMCQVYDHRPKGCTLYPLIVDVDDWTVEMHDFCPYTEEFRFSKAQKDSVVRLVRKQDLECAARQSGRLEP